MRIQALLLLVLCIALPFTRPARGAQTRDAQDQELVSVELRVLSADPNAPVEVDRGTADGVAIGDVVWIEPRGSARQRATVISVEERRAKVRFQDPQFRPDPGARGEVLVPAVRLALEAHEEDPSAGADAVPVPPPVELPLHTSSSGPGTVARVDRGSEQGLELGDAVRFPLPGGGTARGTVTQLGNSTAVVDFPGGDLPATGASGVALIPRARLGDDDPAADGVQSEWDNKDDGWVAGMPLLSQARAVRPGDRPRSISGFASLGGQYRFTNEDGRNDSFTRLGGFAVAENPFGGGGAMTFGIEFNTRTTNVPNLVEENETQTRLWQLSYRHGGTRFDPTRWEIGRFLQNGVAEFGILDGGEVVRRLGNGDRIGASVGFIADPLLRLQSGENLQFAGFYEYNTGERNPLSLTAGYQKSFHDNDSDRDLVITKVRYLPAKGWDLQGTAWIDIYTESDEAKGSGPELTQVWLTTQHQFANGNGLRFGYRHLKRPELLRDEFLPATQEALADQRYDRLYGDGTVWLGQNTAMHVDTGVWNDETESGGDASLGFELRDLFTSGGRGYLTAFGTRGQFSSVIGGRISYGRVLPRGQWELLYEISNQHEDAFQDDRDDILQQRLRASRDFFIGKRWTLSVYAEGLTWDESQSVNLVFYLQRSF